MMKDMDLIKVLTERESALIKTKDYYIETSRKLQETEEVYKVIRAKVLASEAVANLPNQSLRDAEVDQILINHESISPKYKEYLQAKLDFKVAWLNYEVAKELMANIRTIVNNATFAGDTK